MGARSGGGESSRSGRNDPKDRPKKIFGMKAVSSNLSQLQTRSKLLQESLTHTLTSNRFNIGDKPLSEYDDENENMDTKNVNKTSEKKTKNPPIVITGSNVSAVQNFCNEIIKSRKFEVKLLTVGIRIHVAEKTEFETLCQYLTSKNINYFKYHTADTRPRKIVLFGLHAMKTQELKATLNDNGIHPEDIRTLKLRENHYSYDQQTVYLLYFKPGTVKMSDLRNIRAINQIIVKWAPYTPRSHHKYPQCRNFQMYGHSSINCHMPTRCLVCAADHKTDDCQKKVSRVVLEHKRATGAEIDRSFVKCANCGENHAASFHGCEARKKYTELQEKLR